MNKLFNQDCLEALKSLPDNSVDLLCTDSPAGIAFMGKSWDENKGGRDKWIEWLKEIMVEAKRVLKPGAHGFVWALPRTSHWTAMALENAGFEIRDCIVHTFSSGFPKSHNVGLKIDKMNGMPDRGHRIAVANRNHPDGTLEPNGEFIPAYEAKTENGKKWEGWGTALKPACEYWWMIRKPLGEKTVAENVLKWGTGALNIDDARIPYSSENDIVKDVPHAGWNSGGGGANTYGLKPYPIYAKANPVGRFPANLLCSSGIDVYLSSLLEAKKLL